MITIKDFTEAVQYKITGGAEYQWQCFGHNARYLDSESKTYSASIVFDTVTQEVYVAEVWDYANERQYRFINPDYKETYENEYKVRGMDFNQASDDKKFIDLETEEDWIEKATAIVAEKEYDTRISVPIDMPKDELLVLFKLAHERDITFNQLMVDILTDAINKDKTK